MRILLINSVCGKQSTGRIVSDIKHELIKLGHECCIAYGESNSLFETDDYHIGCELTRYIHAASSRIFDDVGFHSKKATKKLIKWIDDYNPDIIHLHNLHGYYINIDILFNYFKKKNTKIIWTLHDCWPFTGHCAYFDYANCTRWKEMCFSCPQKKEYPKSVLFDNSKNNFINKKELFTGLNNLSIVTPSKWLASLVNNSFLSEYKTFVINNGVDISVFKPRESNLRDKLKLNNKIVILGVAAFWDRRKGLSTFIELNKHLDYKKYQIIIVGLNSKQIKSLPNAIIGISSTNNSTELAELYSMADIFVNPTLEDNYPTTNIEAISCGTPVITYDTGGSPESAFFYGSVVKKNDINGLLSEIYKNSFSKKDFDFDCQRTVKKYIELYKYKEEGGI